MSSGTQPETKTQGKNSESIIRDVTGDKDIRQDSEFVIRTTTGDKDTRQYSEFVFQDATEDKDIRQDSKFVIRDATEDKPQGKIPKDKQDAPGIKGMIPKSS